MRLRLLCVGKMREPHYRDAVSEFLKRLKTRRVTLLEMPDSCRQKEGEAILKKIKDDEYVIALSEEGKPFPSIEFAEFLKNQDGDLCFVLGGPDGLSQRVSERANLILSLSSMTFPHELARVLLLEQVYRAFMINEGRSYHR